MNTVESPYAPADLVATRAKHCHETTWEEDVAKLVLLGFLWFVFPIVAVFIGASLGVPGLTLAGIVGGWLLGNMGMEAIRGIQAWRHGRIFDRAHAEIAENWTVQVCKKALPFMKRIRDAVLVLPADKREMLAPIWDEAMVSVEILRHKPGNEAELAQLSTLAGQAEAYRAAEKDFARREAEAAARELEESARREADLVVSGLESMRNPQAVAMLEAATETLRSA